MMLNSFYEESLNFSFSPLNKKLLAKIFRIYQMVGSLEIFILTA